MQELIKIKQPEIAQKIKEAREMGDISENAAYDTAMQEKAYIEGRAAELEELIKSSSVANCSSDGTVCVGSKVLVHVDGTQEEFHIVGPPEANPMEKKISHESPLGSMLMGKKIGDKFEVEAPIGILTYTILKIK